MGQFVVSGPAPLYVSTGASAAYQFLGFARSGVRINYQGKFSRVECDVTGPELWADAQYMGEEATVSLELARPVPAVLELLEARCSSAGSITAGALAGLTPAPAQGVGIGTLMAAEGASVSLCIVNPYQAAKSGQSTTAPCYVFGVTWLADYDREQSTVVAYPPIRFQCINSVNFATGAMQLYSKTLPGSLPAPT